MMSEETCKGQPDLLWFKRRSAADVSSSLTLYIKDCIVSQLFTYTVFLRSLCEHFPKPSVSSEPMCSFHNLTRRGKVFPDPPGACHLAINSSAVRCSRLLSVTSSKSVLAVAVPFLSLKPPLNPSF